MGDGWFRLGVRDVECGDGKRGDVDGCGMADGDWDGGERYGGRLDEAHLVLVG